jgi:K+/H+ antiporter YhaU regulatory subunit KhtT
MIALVSVFVVLLVSLLITRVATLALSMTGMSKESARFQARSALSGVGFTTQEAEQVVRHPVRRRIALVLMMFGSAGVVTAVASLILSFGSGAGSGRLQRAGLLLAGLVALWLLSRSRHFDRALGFVIAPLLQRVGIAERDYATLLALEGDYAVHELEVEEDDWIAGRSLADLKLRDEGVVVLGIHRRGEEYLGVPHGDAVPRPGDIVIVYGRTDRIEDLDRRRRGGAGDRAHAAAVRRR